LHGFQILTYLVNNLTVAKAAISWVITVKYCKVTFKVFSLRELVSGITTSDPGFTLGFTLNNPKSLVLADFPLAYTT
jgi:hypothetical protein